MKRLFIILSILSISLVAFANASFNKTINYQCHNAQAYVGETLYLLPLTGSRYGKNVSERYHNFKSTIYQDGFDMYVGPNTGLRYQYKFDPTDYRDNKPGTHKRHIEGHRFYVNKAVQDPNDDMIWTFYLTDLNTGENLKFIYYAEITDVSIFIDFPFITEKHYKYCKSLIGSKLVFGTISKFAADLGTAYYSTFEKDINTGETINYDKSYAKWTIKDVEIDVYYSCISFIVTNGKQTTKVPYNIQYSDTYSTHYNNCTRVFTETQWNNLVKKYGEAHMESIMANIPLDDMSKEELYMAGGRYAANGLYKDNNKGAGKIVANKITAGKIADGKIAVDGLYKDDNKSAGKIAADAFVKSTKETVKAYKEIFNYTKKALFN